MNTKVEIKLDNICNDIYREMFKRSNPPADFDYLKTAPMSNTPNWNKQYYLSTDIQKQVVKDCIAKYGLSNTESEAVREMVIIGLRPANDQEFSKYNFEVEK